jgi:hypothetical protein
MAALLYFLYPLLYDEKKVRVVMMMMMMMMIRVRVMMMVVDGVMMMMMIRRRRGGGWSRGVEEVPCFGFRKVLQEFCYTSMSTHPRDALLITITTLHSVPGSSHDYAS